MQDKSGDVPAHHKNTHSKAYDSSTQCIYITQVLRRKKQGICAIAFHKTAVDDTAQYIPKHKQYLATPSR